jgi:hypothetical protein
MLVVIYLYGVVKFILSDESSQNLEYQQTISAFGCLQIAGATEV